jgi:hypothetical protein
MLLKKYKWINYILIFLVLYLYHFVIAKAPGDDYKFSKVSQGASMAHWLYSRYNEWSGRLFPDAMLYLLLAHNVWLWRLINPLMIMLLAYCVIRIWRKEIRIIDFLVSLAVIGYFAQSILSSGVFWITGSMNYLWPITLGLVAMIPYADKVFTDTFNFKNSYFVICLICGLLAAIGNEQAALCISCFAVLSHIAVFIQKKAQDKRLLFLTLAIVAGTCIQLLAPGNKVRYVAEAAYWYPGFENFSLREHFYLGTIWAFGKLFDDMKYLILILSIITVIIYFKNKTVRNNWVFKIFIFVFGVIIISHFTGKGLGVLYNFSEIKNFDFSASLTSLEALKRPFLFAFFPYVFWTLYSCLLIYLLVNTSNHKFFVLSCLFAAVATLVVMFFSPTIYASRERTLTVASVLLGMVMIGKIVEGNLINRLFYLCIFAFFPIINFAIMFYKWHSGGFTPFL